MTPARSMRTARPTGSSPIMSPRSMGWRGSGRPAGRRAGRSARLIEAPTRRAVAWFRAADVARQYDYDRAQALYERARTDDPDLVPAIDGLAALLRDRGDLAAVVALLVEAAARPA